MKRIDNIEFCIRYLLEQNGVQAEIPDALKEKQQLLRALMNIWEPRRGTEHHGNKNNDSEEPQKLSGEFLKAQDAELQMQLADKGIVEPEGVLWKGDITRLKVDAIVNAANSRGLGCWHPLHACIDNAIHSAAGLQLRQECNNTLRGGEIATGEAIITPGYNLPAKYVIHTVGPIIATGIPTQEQEQQLADCYRNCLRLAEEKGCRSIAFCCISTGEFRFPNRRAAEIAVETCKDYQNSFSASLSEVHRTSFIFNVFKDIDYDIYRELL